MRRNLNLFALGIVLMACVASFIDLPGTKTFFGRNVAVVLGLDLKGGVRLLYCADKGQTVTSAEMNTARDVMEQRATSGLAVTAPQISVVNGNCIDAEIPGSTNPLTVRKTLGSTGLLVLGDSGVDLTTNKSAIPPGSGEKVTLTPTGVANYAAKPYPIVKVIVPGSDVVAGSASITTDSTTGNPLVNYSLNTSGGTAWCTYTSSHVNYNSPVVLDGKVIVDPVIQQAICGGQTQVSGLSQAQANALKVDLDYGSLPVKLHVASSETLGATLGPTYVHKAEIAGIVGLILVALFMLIYYRLPGLLADVALLIYSLVVFAIFKLIPVTLTLEGVAGFILSIGMAVDANVLIFERMKEELRAGKTLGAAIDSGFNRAWTSIRDSNISTMITTIILFWFGQHFGTSIITGFAETLFIGVAVSMFTAIVVTRTFLRLLVATGRWRSPRLFGLNSPDPAEDRTLGGSVV
jgi:preprotein translocase subunit SecD